MNKTALIACSIAAWIFAAPSPAQAQTAARYRVPGAVVLSPDLAAPWVLQLSRKPARNGRYAVETSTVHVPRPPYVRSQRHGLSAMTPLQADPVRRQRQFIAPSQPQQASAPAPRQTRPEQQFDPQFEMQVVEYAGEHAPGTIIIDTQQRFLYLVETGGNARRYGVGVGRPGFEWAGQHEITRKGEWPDWNPPTEMIAREKAKGKIIPPHMDGGPENPLGARAMYLGNSLYRIHGTNQPWSIGKAVSSGCIRMRNEDVMDLYERVGVGTKVIVS